ncbi:hypothetical protein CHUAL_004390 [Chamberlinius hualienensis]
MSHLEEQQTEIEALESIYSDDFTLLRTDPPFKFQIFIKTSDYDSDSETGASCVLNVQYVNNYPDEVPEFELGELVNVDDEIVDVLIDKLNDLAEQNRGMVMVFTLVSGVQEWLENEIEMLTKKRIEDKEKLLKEAEEAEKKKFEGTRVTVETFLKWKAAFDEEMTVLKKRTAKDELDAKRLTGRQLFEKDHSLYDSDIRFLQQGEEVKIDESLFQDLDELDLDAE